MFTDVKQAVEQIEQRKNRGYGLAHFKDYMKTLENPHLKLKSIHIAGTNGKGSTTNDIRSVLQKAGYRVGSFTSPYMISHFDRIRINDCDIPQERFLTLVNRYYESWIKWDLSMFEIDMCIACIYFLEEQVDYAVFEVGLGGRLDATNILYPLVSVITNIGLDHMEFLGDTKEKIAAEKAGIIKDKIPVITGEPSEECLQVFQNIAKLHHSEVIKVKNITALKEEAGGIQFSYGNYQNIQLSSHAAYQSKNAALAIEVLTYLQNHELIRIEETALREGLREANWIGRFEILQEEPLLLLDGAHNAHGIQALVDSLKGRDHIEVIFSVLKDKNFMEMLTLLQTISKDIVVTPFYNERSLDMHLLQNYEGVRYMESYQAAIQEGLAHKKNLVITGSLYFISEVRAYLLKEKDLCN